MPSIEMADAADDSLIPNSEQEYFDGVAADGRPLNILSRHLIPPRNEHELPPPIGPHAAKAGGKPVSPFHIEADQKILQAERDHIERVRKCVKFLEGTVELGEVGRAILATQAEIELELKRRQLARLKAAPLDELVEGERGQGQGQGQGQEQEPQARGAVAPETRGAVAPGDASQEAGANGQLPAVAPDPEQPNQRGIGVAPMRLHARPAHGTGKAETALQTHGRDGHATLPSRSGQAAAGTPAVRAVDTGHGTPDTGQAAAGTAAVRGPKFSPGLLIMLALRAAKDLPKLSAELRDLEARLRPAEAELKLKQEFYLDKGIALVTDTLSCMDEKFGQIGFGNWMPFRFVDQWFMFCGVPNRVLAAHGLMPSGHAALYRKLLEETPSISLKAADAGPPKSWGLGYRVREHRHFQSMIDRVVENRAGRGPPL